MKIVKYVYEEEGVFLITHPGEFQNHRMVTLPVSLVRRLSHGTHPIIRACAFPHLSPLPHTQPRRLETFPLGATPIPSVYCLSRLIPSMQCTALRKDDMRGIHPC